MEDHSYLDKKYFIDSSVYNCPFCNRRNVMYGLEYYWEFDWSDKKKCYVYFVSCSSCDKTSMHLSFDMIHQLKPYGGKIEFQKDIDIDSHIFYSTPTSFFVLDKRIPRILRELISEAEGCLKMNFLTGASACMRKAIYELIIIEEAEGPDYEHKIKFLKSKYPNSDPLLFDTLAHIQDMTSDKIHEQSWSEWNSNKLKRIIETLKTVLHDIYVLPKVKQERSKYIQQLHEKVSKDNEGKRENE